MAVGFDFGLVREEKRKKGNNALLKPAIKLLGQGGTEMDGTDLRQCRSAVKIGAREGRSIGRWRRGEHWNAEVKVTVVETYRRVSRAQVRANRSVTTILEVNFFCRGLRGWAGVFTDDVVEEFENTISPTHGSRDNVNSELLAGVLERSALAHLSNTVERSSAVRKYDKAAA